MSSTGNKAPQASLNRSFVGAMMSCIVTDALFKGIQGTPCGMKFDVVDSSLAAIQSGISYISYQAAVNSLARFNKKFKDIKDDPKNKSQAVVYVVGGSLGATIATGINYPIEVIREFRRNKTNDYKKNNYLDIAKSMSFKCAERWFTDRVFGYIGFATSMGNIIPHLSAPKNSIHKWAQSQLLIQLSHLNGMLVSYPYQYLRYHASFGPYMKNYMKSVGRKMISSDFSNYFKREISGIPFMQI